MATGGSDTSPWFDRAFGPAYDDLYPHRDEADAARDVDRVLERVTISNERVLDLCCGAGRHLRLLAKRAPAASLTGIDRSWHLLGRAREDLPARIPLVRGDMRSLPFADGSFDLTLNMFTSLGYFEDDSDNLRTLEGVFRTLRKGGRLFLDHIDRAVLEANLVPESSEEREGVTYTSVRRFEGGRVTKHLTSSDNRIDHHESVRVWTPDEMASLLEEAGFSEVDITLSAGRMHIWCTS